MRLAERSSPEGEGGEGCPYPCLMASNQGHLVFLEAGVNPLADLIEELTLLGVRRAQEVHHLQAVLDRVPVEVVVEVAVDLLGLRGDRLHLLRPVLELLLLVSVVVPGPLASAVPP